MIAIVDYLIGGDRVAAEASAANRDVPMFMAHGTYDPVVHLPWAERSRDALAPVAGRWNGIGIRSSIPL